MKITEDSLKAEIEAIYNNIPSQPPHTAEQIVIIKKGIEFYLVAFKYYDFDRLRPLLHPGYKQHSTLVGDGVESIFDAAKMLKGMAEKDWEGPGEPYIKMELKRALVDGPYLIMQQHGKRSTADPGSQVMDIFRHEGGKFVEHWECFMELPDESTLQHSNGIF
ncbi:hypothetical protein LTR84_005809 [Exophiala bonariae]|uniref:SnoaL-like domain-containing protein n=1 Tax=Exophiala bonariae TaxID=1690606 RepID=A0AAV9N6V0_9EURO|nr:hypothetical protein LTR84_005809 [Exophiala bonariae]